MRLPGFVGGSAPARSPFINAEQSVNVFPVAGSATSRPALLGTPGKTVFVAGLQGPIRALFSQDERCFALGDGHFYEVRIDGTVVDRGMILGGESPGSISSNGTGGHALFIVASGRGYTFDLNSNTLAEIPSSEAFPRGAEGGVFIDGYSITMLANANQISLSNLFKSEMWAGLDVAQRESASDRLTAIVVDHLELWLFGTKTTEVWYDTGAQNFPFARVQGGLIEQGAIGLTVAKYDNSLVWLSQNDRGGRVAYRANGYAPLRVSTDELEATWNAFTTVFDARAYSYEEEGHSQWVLSFPTEGRTFVLDGATQLWHERDWWNATTGRAECVREAVHTYCFGRHLVGDRQRGTIYTQSLLALDDAGVPMRRRRRFPYLTNGGKQGIAHRLELDCQVGDGMPNAGAATPDPLIILRYSDDRAHTWSNDHETSLGKLGAYETRVYWDCLGLFRHRVFEFECSDPVPICWREVNLDVTWCGY